MKKFLSALMAIVLAISTALAASAAFDSRTAENSTVEIERNQKPLTPENTLALTHHDKQKQVEVKRSSRVNPHEIRLFSGCPYAVVKQGTKKIYKKISPTRVSVGSEPI